MGIDRTDAQRAVKVAGLAAALSDNLSETKQGRTNAQRAITRGEHDENELRKDFTPSERVAIGRVIEAEVGERRGRPASEIPQNFAEFPRGKETRQIAAERAGFGNETTYRQAKAVTVIVRPLCATARRRRRRGLTCVA